MPAPFGPPSHDFLNQYAEIYYTPATPCFWVVKANLATDGSHNNSGGVWSRTDWQIQIWPADADGRTLGCEVPCEVYDNATVPAQSWSAGCVFRLSPGIAYAASLWFAYHSGYSQSFYYTSAYGRIVGKIIGEGAGVPLGALPSNQPIPNARVQIQRGGTGAVGIGATYPPAPYEIRGAYGGP